MVTGAGNDLEFVMQLASLSLIGLGIAAVAIGIVEWQRGRREQRKQLRSRAEIRALDEHERWLGIGSTTGEGTLRDLADHLDREHARLREEG